MRILPRCTPVAGVQFVERDARIDESARAERERAGADRLGSAEAWLSSCCDDAVCTGVNKIVADRRACRSVEIAADSETHRSSVACRESNMLGIANCFASN